METLKGVARSAAELRKNLQKAGDFLWEEGPLMSHFIDKKGNDFIFQLAESDTETNRWIVFEVSQQHLFDYFERKMHGLDLIRQVADGFVYFIDIDANVNWKQVKQVDVNDIPSGYLPNEESWFDEIDFEPHALQLKQKIQLLQRWDSTNGESASNRLDAGAKSVAAFADRLQATTPNTLNDVGITHSRRVSVEPLKKLVANAGQSVDEG